MTSSVLHVAYIRAYGCFLREVDLDDRCHLWDTVVIRSEGERKKLKMVFFLPFAVFNVISTWTNHWCVPCWEVLQNGLGQWY
jgi:hypothetical protein